MINVLVIARNVKTDSVKTAPAKIVLALIAAAKFVALN